MAEEWNLNTVERSSTIEQVHRELRDAITEGTIPPGAHLREISLARALATSRGTVREAIRQLVQEGLVESVLHRGSFVRAMSGSDWRDVYVAREAIEVGVATRLLENEDELDLGPLDDSMQELRRAAAGQARPTEEVIAADLQFHRELVRLAGSPRLDRAFETLAVETRMLLRHHPEYPWRTYVSDHEKVLEALRRRDPRTPELVAEHLHLSVDLISGAIASKTA